MSHIAAAHVVEGHLSGGVLTVAEEEAAADVGLPLVNGIEDGDSVNCSLSSIGGGFIDNLKEESKNEIAKKIGFDMNLIQREELNINLIHFDANMTDEENYEYFNNFKVDVVGGFHTMDDINIFKKLLVKYQRKISLF